MMLFKKNKKDRILLFVDDARQSQEIVIKEGSCRLFGRMLDRDVTMPMDKFGQRQITEEHMLEIEQNLIDFEKQAPVLSMDLFKRDDDILLDDQSISHAHAMIFNSDGVIWVSDLASTNGTYIDGIAVGIQELMPGSVLSLGSVKLSLE